MSRYEPSLDKREAGPVKIADAARTTNAEKSK